MMSQWELNTGYCSNTQHQVPNKHHNEGQGTLSSLPDVFGCFLGLKNAPCKNLQSISCAILDTFIDDDGLGVVYVSNVLWIFSA